MRPPNGARLVPLAAAMIVSGCASGPLVERPISAPDAEPGLFLEPFEQRQRELALSLTRREQLAQAAVAWEVLALLRPERSEYRKRQADTNAQIKKAVGERLQAAAEAHQRGDVQQATLAYLRVLSLEPDNATAVQALRDMERGRAIRTHQVRNARLPPSAKARTGHGEPKVAPPAYSAERRNLDYGVMLLHQGDYAGSIKLLETFLAGNPKEVLARRTLADACAQLGQQRLQQGAREEALALLEKAQALREQDAPDLRTKILALRRELAEEQYQNGLRAYNNDIRRAIAHFERSLRFDPSHVRANIRLQEARVMRDKLKLMESAP